MSFVLGTSRRRLAACAVVAVAVAGVVAVAPSADASGRYHQPVTAGSHYLALGDSVAFGYREFTNVPTPNYADPTSFVGYPENIGAELGVRTVNATCPGETSDSLINDKLLSYACETPTGYRTNFPLHVKYRTSQLLFALNFLQHHTDTRLVSLAIGANDGFLCQATTTDHCASEFAGVLAKIGKNVKTILRSIRDVGHYRGQIVIVNYYSTNYTDPVQVGQSLALNQAMDVAAKPFHVSVADGYGAFQRAAAQAGGDTCKAGLLTTLSTGGCGVHPSVAGQEVLAGAVERVVNHS
ncbi:MAG: SGNH/GDSL hydrolase family protein [Jatrophihabitans sp.]